MEMWVWDRLEEGHSSAWLLFPFVAPVSISKLWSEEVCEGGGLGRGRSPLIAGQCVQASGICKPWLSYHQGSTVTAAGQE